MDEDLQSDDLNGMVNEDVRMDFELLKRVLRTMIASLPPDVENTVDVKSFRFDSDGAFLYEAAAALANLLGGCALYDIMTDLPIDNVMTLPSRSCSASHAFLNSKRAVFDSSFFENVPQNSCVFFCDPLLVSRTDQICCGFVVDIDDSCKVIQALLNQNDTESVVSCVVRSLPATDALCVVFVKLTDLI